jgi:hypothetical protein
LTAASNHNTICLVLQILNWLRAQFESIIGRNRLRVSKELKEQLSPIGYVSIIDSELTNSEFTSPTNCAERLLAPSDPAGKGEASCMRSFELAYSKTLQGV